jgi:Tfp pilus assembly major pilin PilA
MTLQQDLAQLKSTHASPMQDAEKEIDASGQGLFAWMSVKGLNTQLETQLQGQPPDGLLHDALEHTQSIAMGWGTVEGHGRLQIQVRAPQARLLGYLAANAGDVGLKSAGAPDWAATMALPGQDKLQQIHDNLDRDFGAGLRSGYDAGAAKLQQGIAVDPIAFLGLFGKQVVMFGDGNGSFIAVQVRDRAALYAKLDELAKRFGWGNTVVKVGGGEIHYLHVALPETPTAGGLDPRSAAWLKLYARIGADYYWIEEGDYLVSAKVPQPLIDRMASRPDTSLSDWLRKHQSYDSGQTLLGFTTTTRNVDRTVYYAYLGMLDDLGNALDAPVDLSTLPTARQLKLPTDGIAGFALQANDQRLAVELNYEQTPLESLFNGDGNSMTTVAVVAILAAIAIPAYQDYVIRSQVSEGASLSEGAKTAVAEYYSNRGRMPRDNNEAGIATASSIAGRYTSSVQIDNGRITVTYGGVANSLIKDQVLVFAPTVQGQSIHWSCSAEGGTTIRAKYLPTVCR